MKIMIWKEVRENLMWAALGLVAMALGCAWLISQSLPADNWQGLWTDILPPFVMLAPLLAAVLGFLQTARELKPDQRAFLLHRPVSRSVIFWGKVIAGLCLYALATALPLLCTGLWLSKPGRVAGPFDWRLLWPAAIGILTGASFYFAAIITATRSARWFGSKALALPAAAVCAFAAAAPSVLWQALLILLAFTLVLACAAWGSFVSGGSYALQNKVTRASLGAGIYVGMYAVFLAVFGLTLSLFAGRQSNYTYSRYETDTLGRMVIVNWTGVLIDKVTDLQGKPLPAPGRKPRWSQEDFLTHLNAESRPTQASYREPRFYVAPLSLYGRSDTGMNWYFLPERGLLAGYSAVSNRLEGYVGSNGFKPIGSPAPAPLRGTFLNGMYDFREKDLLRFSDAVYRFDEESRRLTVLYKTTPPSRLAGAVRLYASYDSRAKAKRIMVITPSRFICISPEGRVLYSTVNRHAGRGLQGVELAVSNADDRIFVWSRPTSLDPDRIERPTYVTEMSASGHITKGYSLPALKQNDAGGFSALETLPALVTPPSALAALASYVYVARLREPVEARRASPQTLPPPLSSGLFVGLSVLSAFAGAITAFRISERCRFTGKAALAWSLGVFILGPFGVLLLLALHEWPARETCHTCSKSRLVTFTHCEHCGAPWPAPERDGTEILEESRGGYPNVLGTNGGQPVSLA